MKTSQTALTAAAVTGLALMYHLAGTQPQTTSIGSIEKNMVGDQVTVKGKIKDLSKKDNTYFFNLKNSSNNLDAVMFREGSLIFNGEKVEASGKVTLYRGRKELVVKKISKAD
ncbi:MAG: exodeoxyribonuclease VII large subunit [Candidatus Nanohalobium sp.]